MITDGDILSSPATFIEWKGLLSLARCGTGVVISDSLPPHDMNEKKDEVALLRLLTTDNYC